MLILRRHPNDRPREKESLSFILILTLLFEGGRAMQKSNYDESETHFSNNTQYGWKHFESFIVSEQMFERLLKKMISPEDPLFSMENM